MEVFKYMEVFKIAREDRITTLEASKRLAEKQFLKGKYDRPPLK